MRKLASALACYVLVIAKRFIARNSRRVRATSTSEQTLKRFNALKEHYSPAFAVCLGRRGYAAMFSALAKTRWFTVAVGLWMAAGCQAHATQSYTNTLQSGLNLIANQLDHGSNTLNEIIPSVPDGSVVNTYHNISGSCSNALFNAAPPPYFPATLPPNPP